ncbi:UNVERIFIED_CONTAM: GPI-anchored protein LLG1 [Sesamum calycinum]|uniref:GPI-anchored protein LLG1 n=1 Tax=Sesamum calycinum TaxID=2727403 RepID=A0AAW2IXY5_9LAMI
MKQLVCPVHEQINDLKSNCPETFFSYVNLYGKYPPALFSSLCREGQRGLDCTELLAGPPEQQNGVRPARAHTPLLLLMLFSLLVFNMS